MCKLMQNEVILSLQSFAFGAGLVLALTVVGYGLTRLLIPGDKFNLLLAPAVGLALLSLSFQWLTFVVPPHIAAIVLLCTAGPLTVFVIFRTGAAAGIAGFDVAGAGAIAAAYFVTLSQIVIQRGVLTMGSFPADNIFIYAQAAQYLRDHPMPTAHAAAVSDPGSWYLVSVGPSFPNSVGALDAAVSSLTSLPVHSIFDLVSAVGLVVTMGPTWFFLRSNLNASWWAGAAGCALLATNQLLYWVIGLGLQQESLALPIFVTGLCCVAAALHSGNARTGVLIGLLGAALVGMYLPMSGLLVLCGLGAAIVHLATRQKISLRGLLPVAGAAVGAGMLASLAAIYVLAFRGGLQVWQLVVGTRYAAGAVTKFPGVQYVLGTAPFAHVWELYPLPLGHTEMRLFPQLVGASFLLLALIVVGFVAAVTRQRATEAALLGCGVLFIGYEALIADYPYGFVKAVGYMTPLLSAFAGFGAASAVPISSSRYRRLAGLLSAAMLAVVFLASANAARDMLRLWLMSPPAIAASDLKIAMVASYLPRGSTVLVDEPTNDYGTLVKEAVIAYFLPDRTVRIYSGAMRMGTFQDQNVRPPACAFDYVLRALPPEGSFALVGEEPVTRLNIYRRIGPACTI